MGKFVIKLDYNDSLEDDEHTSPPLLDINLNINKILSGLVNSYKDMITVHYNNRTWDKYKKVSNEYEYIYSSPSSESNVSSYYPISRSFFKLWEIIHDFNHSIFKECTDPLKCLFLAEGPGGFVEAFQKFRTDYHNQTHDELVGMTLKSDANRSVPDWKFKSKLRVFYGADGTGNLYHKPNLESLKATFGGHSFHIITADGGFDFSSDFNNQEVMCFRLLIAESLAALYTQREGGTFILKIFDIFHEKTLRLIILLQKVYKQIYIIKPITSRPANSEKYLVCTGFHQDKATQLQHVLEKCLENEEKAADILKTHIPMSTKIIQDIIYYNTYFVLRQVHSIQKTLKLIQDQVDTTEFLNANKRKCQDWCNKYKI